MYYISLYITLYCTVFNVLYITYITSINWIATATKLFCQLSLFYGSAVHSVMERNSPIQCTVCHCTAPILYYTVMHCEALYCIAIQSTIL